MSYSNYRQIEDAIREGKPFEGNSARGVFSTLDGYYRVYSYNTLIARIMPYTMAQGELNTRRYSNTTSRLQNIVRRAWAGVPIVEMEG